MSVTVQFIDGLQATCTYGKWTCEDPDIEEMLRLIKVVDDSPRYADIDIENAQQVLDTMHGSKIVSSVFDAGGAEPGMSFSPEESDNSPKARRARVLWRALEQQRLPHDREMVRAMRRGFDEQREAALKAFNILAGE